MGQKQTKRRGGGGEGEERTEETERNERGESKGKRKCLTWGLISRYQPIFFLLHTYRCERLYLSFSRCRQSISQCESSGACTTNLGHSHKQFQVVSVWERKRKREICVEWCTSFFCTTAIIINKLLVQFVCVVVIVPHYCCCCCCRYCFCCSCCCCYCCCCCCRCCCCCCKRLFQACTTRSFVCSKGPFVSMTTSPCFAFSSLL